MSPSLRLERQQQIYFGYFSFFVIRKPYPISDHNGQNLYPFSDQNGSKTTPFGVAHTYIALYISSFIIVFEFKISFSWASKSRRIETFLDFIHSRFRKYFEFFSPFSYQFALDLINFP